MVSKSKNLALVIHQLFKLFRHRETTFSVNLIPFGGFVQMTGENGPEDDEDQAGSFHHKSMKARLQVILAGVLFNFIFGIVAFSIVFYQLGIPKPLFGQARIAALVTNSPAIEAGLQENTNIVAFQTAEQWVEINNVAQAQEFVASHLGETLGIRTSLPCEEEKCPSSYEEKTIYLRTAAETPAGEGSMGVIFTDVVFKTYPWYLMPLMTIVYAFKQSLDWLVDSHS
jgi:regulator of sigma E protease